MVTRTWVEQHAFQKLKSLEKMERFIARARDILQGNKLQQCAWKADGTLTATCSGGGAESYSVLLCPAEAGQYNTHCSCPSHHRDGVCKHALAALLWTINHPPPSAPLQQQQEEQHQLTPVLADDVQSPHPFAGQHVTKPMSPHQQASGVTTAFEGSAAIQTAANTPISQAGKRKRVLPGSLRPPSAATQALQGHQAANQSPHSAAKRKAAAARKPKQPPDDDDVADTQHIVKRATKTTAGLAKRRTRIAAPAVQPQSPGLAHAAAEGEASDSDHGVATALSVRQYPWMLTSKQMLAVTDEQLQEQAKHCLEIVGRLLPTGAMLDAKAAVAAVSVAEVPHGHTAMPQTAYDMSTVTLLVDDHVVDALRVQVQQIKQQQKPDNQQAMPQAQTAELQQQQQQQAKTPLRSTGLSKLLYSDDDETADHECQAAAAALVASSVQQFPGNAAGQVVKAAAASSAGGLRVTLRSEDVSLKGWVSGQQQQQQQTTAGLVLQADTPTGQLHAQQVDRQQLGQVMLNEVLQDGQQTAVAMQQQVLVGAGAATAAEVSPATVGGEARQQRGGMRSNLAALASRFLD